MATWNSRGLRGSGLEDLINRTNESYREKGLALIQKVPTPITDLNATNSNAPTCFMPLDCAAKANPQSTVADSIANTA